MKYIELYRCERCGTVYTSKKYCELCEEGLEPDEIVGWSYETPCLLYDGYPSDIAIRFEDNTIAHYVLNKWPGECELKDRAEKYIVEKI